MRRGFRSAAAIAATLLLTGCGSGAGSSRADPGATPSPMTTTSTSRPGTSSGDSGLVGAVPDPGWRLRELDGPEIALGDRRGHPVVVNLWATWCPPCVEELASLDRLAVRVSDIEVDFLLVTAEDEDVVRDFVSRRPLGLLVHLEETLAPEAFGPMVLPTTFVLDAEGVIRLHHRGASDWDTPEVEAFLRALAEEGS